MTFALAELCSRLNRAASALVEGAVESGVNVAERVTQTRGSESVESRDGVVVGAAVMWLEGLYIPEDGCKTTALEAVPAKTAAAITRIVAVIGRGGYGM